MSQTQIYKVCFPGQQSWLDVDKKTYFSLKRRKGSLEKILSLPRYHYLTVPSSWTDELKKKF